MASYVCTNRGTEVSCRNNWRKLHTVIIGITYYNQTSAQTVFQNRAINKFVLHDGSKYLKYVLVTHCLGTNDRELHAELAFLG